MYLCAGQHDFCVSSHWLCNWATCSAQDQLSYSFHGVPQDISGNGTAKHFRGSIILAILDRNVLNIVVNGWLLKARHTETCSGIMLGTVTNHRRCRCKSNFDTLVMSVMVRQPIWRTYFRRHCCLAQYMVLKRQGNSNENTTSVGLWESSSSWPSVFDVLAVTPGQTILNHPWMSRVTGDTMWTILDADLDA